ncbi:MAG: nucleoside-diphosphate-sugar epimerase [Parcubacteria group bacterium Athens0714_24]|nr:MAG: nucleoside-diphosphate-sugar epimerase [Parcubacteria group bacterium Athens0714_24]
MKILVTGVAGAIGSHAAERFAELDHEVAGIDCLTDYYSPAIKKINLSDVEKRGVKIFLKDLAIDDISDVVSNVDLIFHFAAQPGISATTPFENYLKNNIIATQRLLEAARKNFSLKGFIFISTSSIYGLHAIGDEKTEPQPASNYGVTKLAAEQLALSYCRDSKMPVSVLRLFSVYGERERPEKLYHKLIKSILEDKDFPLYEGSKEHKRSYTYVGDIIDACVLVLNNFDKANGEIFNIGNDKVETTGEGIEIIEELLGKKAKFLVLPRRAGDQSETSADITKARKILGYNPKIDLREGLAREVEWYKNKIHNKI